MPERARALKIATMGADPLLGRRRAANPATDGTALPPALDRRFEAVVFDWDGTAVPDRRVSAGRVRRLVEQLSGLGFDLAVVSGTHVGNVDGQLAARPPGPGRLYLCLNRGSEVFEVGPSGPALVFRRTAAPDEEGALDRAAGGAVERLRERGLHAEVVSQRLNRRKIDLIHEPAWADPPKARIAELLAAVEARLRQLGIAGLPEVVEIARAAAIEAGLDDARVTSDVKHVEIGLTDKSDSARWLLSELGRHGIDPGAVLVVGDEMGPLGGLPGSDSLLLVPEAAAVTAASVGVEPGGLPPGVVGVPGGPAAFAALLEDQLRRRQRGDLPELDAAPEWKVSVEGVDARLERAHEALLTIADGRIGTGGHPLLDHRAARPRVLAAGLYDGDGADSRLLPCPIWNLLRGGLEDERALRRTLDLRTGLIGHEVGAPDEPTLAAVLFASAARPGTVVLRAEGAGLRLRSDGVLCPPPRRTRWRSGGRGGRRWLQLDASRGGVVAAVYERRLGGPAPRTRVERLGAYAVDPARTPAPEAALAALTEAEDAGFERLLYEQRAAWADRWADADVRIEGDPQLQRDVRFALFHLLASVGDAGESALGARGLSGHGYRGHVFWDTDVFVLPFLAATRPEAARTLLEYRLRRLDAARTQARALGRAGAGFPWESARSGRDVTPSHAHLRTGELVPIRTGELEEHLVADVAWAACCYPDWSGDETFRRGPGLALLVETARYWASRIRLDDAGRGHIEGVIGPDEYHEAVDDNAYTNVLARVNLRRAAGAVATAPGTGVGNEERSSWLRLAEALVDGYEPASGLYEQFAGFFALEPLVIAELAPRRPIAADLLLGRERVEGAQVVKQADVLMLHHLIPDEVAPGSLEPNLRFYEPRTAHGSSLSPGIHASLLARAGKLEEALKLLRLTSRIDLDDLTETTASGLHLAAMGSLWQALAYGFAGLRPAGDALRIDPRLPQAWDALELRVRFRGRRVQIRIEPEAVHLTVDAALRFLPAGRRSPVVVSREARLVRRGNSWAEAKR